MSNKKKKVDYEKVVLDILTARNGKPLNAQDLLSAVHSVVGDAKSWQSYYEKARASLQRKLKVRKDFTKELGGYTYSVPAGAPVPPEGVKPPRVVWTLSENRYLAGMLYAASISLDFDPNTASDVLIYAQDALPPSRRRTIKSLGANLTRTLQTLAPIYYQFVDNELSLQMFEDTCFETYIAAARQYSLASTKEVETPVEAVTEVRSSADTSELANELLSLIQKIVLAEVEKEVTKRMSALNFTVALQ